MKADIVLISTSEPNGLCFIETAELDGFVICSLNRTSGFRCCCFFSETNLKYRQALEETTGFQDDLDRLGEFDGKKNLLIMYMTPVPSCIRIFKLKLNLKCQITILFGFRAI